MIDPQIENGVVLVTGANHGIGAATAKALAAQGAKVFLSYYRGETHYTEEELNKALESRIGGDALYRAIQSGSANSIVRDIREDGGNAFAYEADLTDPGNIPLLFDLCELELGPVDILINNHTHCVPETFDPERLSEEGSGIKLVTAAGIDTHFAINTRAYTLMMSEYLQRYIQRKARSGRIINISTDASLAHTANISYAASKHAIESYSRSAATEMGRYGVTVNIVAPGPIQTGYITPEAESQIATNTPLCRLGEPADVADVIVFLASEQARWLTGQLIYVSGGFRMHQ